MSLPVYQANLSMDFADLPEPPDEQNIPTSIPQPHADIAANVHIGVRKTMDDINKQGHLVYWTRKRFSELPFWLLSTIVHAMALIILSLLIANNDDDIPVRTLLLQTSLREEIMEDVSSEEFELQEPEIDDPADSPVELIGPEQEIVEQPKAKVETVSESDLVLAEVPPDPLGDQPAASIDELAGADILGRGLGELLKGGRSATGSSSLKGRSKGNKESLLKAFGGTAESEAAVYLGLKWLAEHQNEDGSWSSMGNSKIRGAPSYTGLALLSFLGAGITDKDKSEFSDNVYRGLSWLVDQQTKDGDFKDYGRGYGHAIATMAICEAYAITKQLHLKKSGALAVKHIVRAQGPDGGWRYSLRSDGDLSVTGWDLMALKSAKISYIPVPANTIKRAYSFVSRCEVDNSSNYGFGYVPGSGRTLSMSAEGLLMMQYKGMRQGDRRMIAGANYLAENIPKRSLNNPYYWYYGTQVMHHYGGENWEKWNDQVRESLVAAQEKGGDLRGSWQFGGSHSTDRLYHTCLAIMTLEVYYRYLPLYRTHKGAF